MNEDYPMDDNVEFAESGVGDDVSEFDDESDFCGSDEPNDSMDGDFDSAMASAGLGTDEDYGGGTHYPEDFE